MIEQYQNEFNSKGYTFVKNFLDPVEISTVSYYLENSLKRYPENNLAQKTNDDSSQVAWYADPLIEVLLKNSTGTIEEITGLKLFPTYSYARVYLKGDELKRHIDRPSCEISVTCNVATVGKPWPIYMQAAGSTATEHYLEPGDACVYKGCEILHWREKATDIDANVQFMLHYVNQNGPKSEYKYDLRSSLGSQRGRTCL